MVVLAARFAWWSGLRSNFRFRQSLGRGNSPLSVRELRPHFPDSPGDPDGSGSPGPFNGFMSGVAATGVLAASGQGSSIGSTVSSLIDSIRTFFSPLARPSRGAVLPGLG